MGKVFTITEGLENMGALRTGGQGSVYKARRVGEIISAVKLLPTPIHNEDNEDKNYRDFINEVEKLKKVNEVPNPNVVKILSYGLTESGSFPFIEMEFIEGPDLQELLEPPHDPVFSVHELIKVATQLSNALAHCHKVGVKHGDIKSNNIKFNAHTGNYVLLDFGLAIMSDEQRRTSLRHAGAIEFMAPEQNEGQMLFESDIYSFGVILYELLAGTVPFPLNDKGETARNKVMISHMETPVPDVLELRARHLPKSWSAERRESEMRVPAWMLDVINKCLEKNPAQRFKNGVDLNQSVLNNYAADVGSSEALARRYNQLERENGDLKSRLQHLEAQEVTRMTGTPDNYGDPSKVSLSRPVYYGLILLLIGLLGFTAYSYYNRQEPAVKNVQISESSDSSAVDSAVTSASPQRQPQDNFDKKIRELIDSTIVAEGNNADSATTDSVVPSSDQVVEPAPPADNDQDGAEQRSPKYTLSASRAYFYNSPEDNSRRNNFLAKWNSPELTALEDKNGFIYVVFFTINGQVTKGWLRKRDLRRIGA